MGTEVFFIAVMILMVCAVMDLVVGVSNDAANFLNASIGSRVAPGYVIMIIASIGILTGVLFSSGMMEVARKGIFNPQFFTMPQLITIFLAVMLTDILLLDFFNSLGLPTSTTVSIVFELLGAAVAVSVIMMLQRGENLLALGHYINTAKAMAIVFGILFSVVIAFVAGGITQFIARMVFTFNYKRYLQLFGGIWGGIAMAVITFFILIKGAKGATFLSSETQMWIKTNWHIILLSIFVFCGIVFQILVSVFKVNIFKPLILVGTFALAMAFAANDLVNFIGVPLAGLHAYKAAIMSGDPINSSMAALSGKVQSETIFLLIAGTIMVVTLWFSKKARSVSATEISLGNQDEGVERFESIFISRGIVRTVDSFFTNAKKIIPRSAREFVAARINVDDYKAAEVAGEKVFFDPVRASVNLVVASAVISYATSMKLPLSTTYVTFMVAMGTSFSDKAWGSESAVYRVTGVLTVVGGWFMTAFIAFSVAFVFANIISYAKIPGVVFMICFVIFAIRKTSARHEERVKHTEETQFFGLGDDETDVKSSIGVNFEQTGHLIMEIRVSLDKTFKGLITRNISELRKQKKQVKTVQLWINIIIANIFKTMRLITKEDDQVTVWFRQTIRRLQKLSDAYRDIVLRSYSHISNNHSGLLDSQIEELESIRDLTFDILDEMESIFKQGSEFDYLKIEEKNHALNALAVRLDDVQIERIRNHESKTRLSILYYSIIGDCKVIARQNLKLLKIFIESFSHLALTKESGKPEIVKPEEGNFDAEK